LNKKNDFLIKFIYFLCMWQIIPTFGVIFERKYNVFYDNKKTVDIIFNIFRL